MTESATPLAPRDILFHLLVDAIAAEVTPGLVVSMNDIDDAADRAIEVLRREAARAPEAARSLADALGLSGATTP